MHIADMPTDDLRRVLADTERNAGPKSAATRALRDELSRRIALGLAPASALRPSPPQAEEARDALPL